MLGITLVLVLGACKKTSPVGESLPYPRTLLVELFTNIYCPNCEVAEAFIDSLASANPEVVVIAYHDPVYNPLDPFSGEPAGSEIEERNQFYFGASAHGYPYVIFDGILENEGIDEIAGWGNQVAYRLAQNTAVHLEVSGLYDSVSQTGTLWIQADGDTGTTGRVFIALTESDLQFSGKVYRHVFRKFFPDAQGLTVTFPAETVVTFTVDPTWNPASLSFVVFVQDPNSHEVFQATTLPLTSLPPDTTHGPTPLPFTLSVSETLFVTGADPLVDTLFIVNTGTASDRYGLWIDPAFPSDSSGQPSWFLSLCRLGSMCLPYPHDTTDTVAPGDSAGYTIDVYTLGHPGEGEFWIFVHSMADPTLRDSLRVRIQIAE